MTLPTDDATVSVVIPVKDAGDDLPRLLSALRNQRGLKALEIVVVDSGSTDRSADTARDFDATVICIAPEDFSHSGTRNLAARHARHSYLLFMVQDALPTSELWLLDLLSRLTSGDVAAVSCAEQPKEDADLFYKVSLWFHNRFMEVDGQDRIMSKPVDENYMSLRKNSQLSNIACLMSRSLFLRYGFRGDFGEDLELGVRLIKDGHRLALLGSTRVLHSHNRPPYYHLKRGYVDALLLSQMFVDFPVHAIDADDLLEGVRPVFDVVDSIVRRELRQLAVPCTIDVLSRTVLDALRVPKPIDVAPMEPDILNLAGAGLESFLQRFCSQSRRDGGVDSVHPIVLGAVSGALGGVFEYMINMDAVVDEPVLQDFTSCLYKTCAIQCGFLLGASFARGSEMSRNRLRHINAELTQGV